MPGIEKMDIGMAGKRSDDSVKPCPFCGSENIAYGKYEHNAGTRWAILCMNCMAQIDPGWAQSWGAVQELWNRRIDVHGKYIEAKISGMSIYPDNQKMCSICKTIMPSKWRVMPPYCFSCGAKMDDYPPQDTKATT